LSTPIDKGLVKIQLQDYLKDIVGYALIRPKSDFIRNFEEIDFQGTLYKYNDEEGFLEVTDMSSLRIDDYVNGKELKYLSIPLIESYYENDFKNGMKFTEDDIDEVISKMDRDLNWISIIVPKEYQDSLTAETIDNRSYIFEKLNFDELVELGHSDSCSTKSFVKTITLFEGKKNDLYLPFDNKDRDSGYYWMRTPDKRKELFMRSVLIKDFYFSIPISASIFEIKTIVANINSRKFIPDISRNNVDLEAKNLINYMVGKAIHIGATNVLTLEPDEKLTLENFICTFYDQKTDYEK